MSHEPRADKMITLALQEATARNPTVLIPSRHTDIHDFVCDFRC